MHTLIFQGRNSYYCWLYTIEVAELKLSKIPGNIQAVYLWVKRSSACKSQQESSGLQSCKVKQVKAHARPSYMNWGSRKNPLVLDASMHVVWTEKHQHKRKHRAMGLAASLKSDISTIQLTICTRPFLGREEWSELWGRATHNKSGNLRWRCFHFRDFQFSLWCPASDFANIYFLNCLLHLSCKKKVTT